MSTFSVLKINLSHLLKNSDIDKMKSDNSLTMLKILGLIALGLIYTIVNSTSINLTSIITLLGQ